MKRTDNTMELNSSLSMCLVRIIIIDYFHGTLITLQSFVHYLFQLCDISCLSAYCKYRHTKNDVRYDPNFPTMKLIIKIKAR